MARRGRRRVRQRNSNKKAEMGWGSEFNTLGIDANFMQEGGFFYSRDGRGFTLFLFTIDALLQLLAYLEEGEFFWSHLNGFASPGITPRIGLVVAVDETAKASNFDPIPPHQGLGHGVEDQVNGLLGTLFRDLGFLRDVLN
jgi:hypothetical protein